MSALTNLSLAPTLDMLFGRVPAVATSNCTVTNASASVTVTGDTVNIPPSGYVSGTGIPTNCTYSISGSTVTLGSVATAGGSGVALTFSKLPPTFYFALFTSAPTSSGGGTEVTGGSYARVAVVNNPTNFPATSGNNKLNGTAIQFPAMPACTVVSWGIYDAASGGNLVHYGSLNAITYNAGDSSSWAIGQFDLTF